MIQIQTTTGRKEEADKIAKALVEAKLAACAQVIGPINSIYRWQGRIETAQEWLCIIKTRTELFAAVEARIKALNSYETPEIMALPVERASAGYLAWLEDSTAEK